MADQPVIQPMQLLHIWREVASGRGNHGDFLVNFAFAYIRADPENQEVLWQAAVQLVTKYKLVEYLDTQEWT